MGKIGKWQGTGVPDRVATDAGGADIGASCNPIGGSGLVAAGNIDGAGAVEETSSLSNSSQETLQQCVYLMSLLAQFRISANRFPFARFPIAKRYNINDNEWGCFCESVLPNFSTCTLGKSFEAVLESSQINLLNLVQRRDDRLLLQGVAGKGRSFKTWHNIVTEAIMDDAWMATNYLPPPPSGQGHLHQSSTDLAKDVLSVGSNTVTVSPVNVATSTSVIATKDKATATLVNQHNVGTCTSELFARSSTASQSEVIDSETGKTENVKNNVRKKVINQSSPVPSDIECDYKMFRNTSNAAGKLNVISCCFCNKNGHIESNCWKKLGLCLICGGRHKLRYCFRYVARPGAFQPKCPDCSGPHLGIHCAKVTKGFACNFCGKRGHKYERCRFRLHQCLLCGDSNHKVENCSRNVRKRSSLLFPPWCVECCSQHIIGDCESPYME